MLPVVTAVEILITMVMEFDVFWYLTPCRLENGYRNIGEEFCLQGSL
jgi:hypothetical protein